MLCAQGRMKTESRYQGDAIHLLRDSIPAIDVIDLDYGPFNLYWHSRYDTSDKCRPGSLSVTGALVLTTLRALESMPTVSCKPVGSLYSSSSSRENLPSGRLAMQ